MKELISVLEKVCPEHYDLFVVKSHMAIPQYLYKLAAYLYTMNISYDDDRKYKVVYDAILHLEQFGSLESFTTE